MNSDQRFATCSIPASVILALTGGVGTLSATLGVPLAAIALGAISAFVCAVAFTLLIWAAIQDGKQRERAAA